MRIDLISAAFPPALDGIGDYTYRLAEALRQQAEVRVLTCSDEPVEALDGVKVEPCFTLRRRNGVLALQDALQRDPPDALVLQYNPFSWGRWGLNPYLVGLMRAIKRRWPNTKLAVMFHENYVPVTGWKFAVMTTWQRWQFRRLGDLADVLFFSIEPWVLRYRPWWPSKPVIHLPVGSNLPFCPPDRAVSRAELGIDDNALVCGVFGTAHASRMLDWVGATVREFDRQGHRPVLLYIGPHGQTIRQTCKGVRIIDAGRLPAEKAAAHFPVMDLFLSPFIDGLSTRRGSAMAALQHGVPVVSTEGPLTDSVFTTEEGEAVCLAPCTDSTAFIDLAQSLAIHKEKRLHIGKAGQQLHATYFTWSAIAMKLCEGLQGRISNLAFTDHSAPLLPT